MTYIPADDFIRRDLSRATSLTGEGALPPVTDDLVNDVVRAVTAHREARAHPIKIGWNPRYKSTNGWRRFDQISDVRSLFRVLRRHPVNPIKEGSAILQGMLDGGTRSIEKMAFADIMALDIDSGHQTPERVARELQSYVTVGLVSTTHSHMTAVSRVTKDALDKLGGANDGAARRHLIEKKGLNPALVGSAMLGEEIDLDGKPGFLVAHDPIPKMRIFLPLKERFYFKTEDDRQRWRGLMRAVALRFGATVDEKTLHPNALFFTPRHAEGAPFAVHEVAGNLLDLSTYTPVAEDPKPTKSEGAKKSATFQVAHLTALMTAYGEDISITEIMRDAFGAENYTSRGVKDGTEKGIAGRCPNCDAHTPKPGSDWQGGAFFCDAGQDGKTHAFGSCSHNGCVDVSTWSFIDRALQALDIEDATDSRLESYVPDFDPARVLEQAPFASYQEAQEACSADRHPSRTKDTRPAQKVLGLARRVGRTKWQPGEIESLLPLLVTPLVPLKAVQAAAKAVKGSPPRDGQSAVADCGLPEHFENMGDETVYFPPDGEKPKKVCSPVRNLGALYDEESLSHGHLIEFVDRFGATRTLDYTHEDTLKDAGAFLRQLAKSGMWFRGSAESHALAISLCSDMPMGEPILNATKPGFHTTAEGVRVCLPLVGDPVMAKDTTARARLQDKVRGKVPKAVGSLDGWLDMAAEALTILDFHATLSIAAGFAGPVLNLIGHPSCGMFFSGGPGTGKSLGMKVGAAIGAEVLKGRGFFLSAKATGTGSELMALRAHCATLYVDEFSRMAPKERQGVLMMFAEGLGSTRGNVDIALQDTKHWSLYVVLNSEVERAKLLEEGGMLKTGGIERRLPEIDATGAKKCDDLGRIKGLESSIDNDCGWAAREFLQYLFDQGYVTQEGSEKLRQIVTAKADALLGEEGKKKSGAVQSAAFVMAIANVAGLFAREAGLFPVVNGRDIDADFMVAWRDRCEMGKEGGEISSDAQSAIPAFWGKLDSLMTMHGVDIGNLDNVPLNRDHLFYIGRDLIEGAKPYVVIRADGMTKLLAAHIKVEDFLRVMKGNVIRRGKKDIKWNELPKLCGGKPGPNYRFFLPEGDWFGEGADS